MSMRTLLVGGCLMVGAFTLGAQPQEGDKIETSPHAAALELVFKTQAARIRAVDTENWWHDVKERTWSVRRPFSPGYIDSTYMFEVSYRIDGNVAAAWLVDTRKKTVELRQPKAK